MKAESGYEGRRARIEMIALLDVVFLLLVFFIYTMLSLTVHRGLEIVLPEAEGDIQREQPILIVLDRENRLLAAEQYLSQEQCVAWVMTEYSRQRRPVLIQGHREADLGVALELLSLLRQAGLGSVNFQVEQPR